MTLLWCCGAVWCNIYQAVHLVVSGLLFPYNLSRVTLYSSGVHH